MSTEPQALAEEGCEVTAVDSEIAIEYSRGHPASKAEVEHWFSGETAGPPWAGGRLIYLPGSIATLEPSTSFDVVYLPAPVWQSLDRTMRKAVVHRFFSWVRPGGALLIHIVGGQQNLMTEAVDLTTVAGFFWAHRNDKRLRASSAEDYVRNVAAELAESAQLLATGAKMAIIFWSSG